jgi:hypothetical protein
MKMNIAETSVVELATAQRLKSTGAISLEYLLNPGDVQVIGLECRGVTVTNINFTSYMKQNNSMRPTDNVLRSLVTGSKNNLVVQLENRQSELMRVRILIDTVDSIFSITGTESDTEAESVTLGMIIDAQSIEINRGVSTFTADLVHGRHRVMRIRRSCPSGVLASHIRGDLRPDEFLTQLTKYRPVEG